MAYPEMAIRGRRGGTDRRGVGIAPCAFNPLQVVLIFYPLGFKRGEGGGGVHQLPLFWIRQYFIFL